MATTPAEEFLKTGHVVISIPNSFVFARAVALGFQSFLADVPPEKRSQWSFSAADNEDPDGSPDDGFISRGGEERKVSGGKYDAKSVFHYRPYLKELLAEREIDYSRQAKWFFSCGHLFGTCSSMLSAFTQEIDRAMPGYHFFERFSACSSKHRIRVIQYSERGVDDPLIVGKKHADRNFITLQISESQKGLRIYPNGSDGEPVPYEAIPNNILAFPGQKFESLTSGRVRALPHDIVNTDPVAPPRWSVIFFSHIDISS